VKNGKEKSSFKLQSFIEKLNSIGVGEVVINSIDKDGTMTGYDLNLVQLVRDHTDFPMTVLGGVGSIEDIRTIIAKFKIIGAAAGSLFVFKGKYRAVLINYPNRKEKFSLLKEAR
jgi:imidazole glycerol-phosphate synthase subunit HisF